MKISLKSAFTRSGSNLVLTLCLHSPIQSTYSHMCNLLISEHPVMHIEIYGGQIYCASILPF
ncbi:hypothetical protein BT93_L4816 [Corymbia citriodora subsp. variegata]|uniref:Uncharacterized protein n=1 Tax=Corymbia citriodora subsp. variegata TaxID=360336 RepID=A0A8T0CXM0_CORYI|nr:hypothetical protein BT93_L4816 [Corymbia citriodora subsp. variegata]